MKGDVLRSAVVKRRDGRRVRGRLLGVVLLDADGKIVTLAGIDVDSVTARQPRREWYTEAEIAEKLDLGGRE